MKKFAHLVKNHLIESDVDKFPAALAPYREELEGRSVLVKKAKPLPVECIVRGYITGSGWKDYKATGSVCGYKLPEGLLESARLEQPLFTPSTKAELGEHDENISTARAAEILGKDIAARSRASPSPSSRKAAHGLKAAASSLPTPNLNSAWLTAS